MSSFGAQIKFSLLLYPLLFLCVQVNAQSLKCNTSLNDSRDASFSPDGTKIIFSSSRETDNDIYIMNNDGTNIQLLIRTSNPDYYPFFSPDGKHITFDSYGNGTAVIYISDSDGKNLKRLTDINGFNADPYFSPDGSKIVFYSKRDGHDQIYTMNPDGTNQKRLTLTNTNEMTPVWSPDGSKIVFVSTRDGNSELYLMNADGSDQKRLTNNSGTDRVPKWSPDGTRIIYYSKKNPRSVAPHEETEIVLINPDGINRETLTNDDFPDQGPSFSSDGKYILYTSCRGNREVFLMKSDGSEVQQLTFTPQNE